MMGQLCQICYSMPCRCNQPPSQTPFNPFPMTPGPLQWVPHEHKPSQRELIATAAMAAIATSTVNGWVGGEGDAKEIAKRALLLADALIAVLNSPSNPGAAK